jgi:adenine-specific DNA glycosylase
LPENSARWAGLWALPFVEMAEAEAPSEAARRILARLLLRAEPQELLTTARHTITRFRIRLHVVRCEPESADTGTDLSQMNAGLFTRAKAEALAIPSVHRRLIRQLAPL